MAKKLDYSKWNNYAPRIIDFNTKLWFGKYKGKTLEQINDKDYFVYLRDNTTIQMTADVVKYTFAPKEDFWNTPKKKGAVK